MHIPGPETARKYPEVQKLQVTTLISCLAPQRFDFQYVAMHQQKEIKNIKETVAITYKVGGEGLLSFKIKRN